MDEKNRNGLLAVCFTIAILGHFLFVLGAILTFEDKENHIGGFTGDVDKKVGASTANVVPIKLDTKVADSVEALEIIAQRIQEARQAQTAEEKAEEEQPEDGIAEIQKRKDAEAEKAKEQERAKEAALEKARVLAEEKAKKEQEEKRKIEERKKLEEKIKSQKNNATGTQNRSSASGQSASQNAQSQARRENSTSSVNQEAADTKANINDLFNNGAGGGDGAKVNDYSAADVERYRQRIQAIIYKNFNISGQYANRGCRISIDISKDGTLSGFTILDNGGQAVCDAAQRAIEITKKVPPPNPQYYDQVHFSTIYFIYKK